MVLALCLAVVIAAGLGLPFLSVTSDTRVFFSAGDPRFNELVEFEAKYLPSHNILYAVHSADPLERSPIMRSAVGWLASRVDHLPNIRRVDSISTVSYPHEQDGTIEVTNYLAFVCPGDQCISSRLETLRDPLIKRRLVSEDRRTIGVMGVFDLDLDEAHKIREISDASQEIKREFEVSFPSLRIAITGGIPMSQAFVDVGQRDSTSLFVGTALLVTALLALVLADIRTTLVILLTAISASIVSMGTAGWLGVTLNSASSTVPIIVLTLVIASSMHLFLHYNRLREDRRGAEFAIVSALNSNWKPILMTCATSAVSLVSLTFVDSPPVQDIGILSALGVLTGGIFTIVLAPLLLNTESLKRDSTFNRRLQAMLNTYALRLKGANRLLIGAALFLSLCLFGLARLHIDDNFVEYFSQATEFRQDTDFVTEQLTGPNHIEVDLLTEGPGQIFEAGNFKALVDLSSFLKRHELVASVVSLSDVLTNVATAFGDEINNSTSAETLAQYYLAYSLSLRKGESATALVSQDLASTHISVLLSEGSAADIRGLEASIRKWASVNVGGSTKLVITGENIPVAHLSSSNIPAAIRTITTSLVFAGVLIGIIFRNWKIAVSAFCAMVIPVASGFGVWGWISESIGLAGTIVVAVALGVVIDDAIHLIYRQRLAAVDLSQDAWESAAYSVHHVGVPIIATTLVLSVGLLPLAISEFQLNSTFAICTIIILSTSLLFDLAILPKLMAWSLTNQSRTTN
jgi:predicted RND superfamily exporter protein